MVAEAHRSALLLHKNWISIFFSRSSSIRLLWQIKRKHSQMKNGYTRMRHKHSHTHKCRGTSIYVNVGLYVFRVRCKNVPSTLYALWCRVVTRKPQSIFRSTSRKTFVSILIWKLSKTKRHERASNKQAMAGTQDGRVMSAWPRSNWELQKSLN